MGTIFCEYINDEVHPSVCNRNFSPTKPSCKNCHHNPQKPKPVKSPKKRRITRKEATKQASPFNWFTEKEHQRLAKVLSVPLSEEDRLLLNRIRQSYFIDKEFIEKGPSRPKKTGLENLKRIKKLTEPLIERLEKLDDYSKDVLFLLSQDTFSRIQEGRSDIHRLKDALDNALNNLKPDRGGRPRPPAMTETIIRLADFFEQVIGRSAGCTRDPVRKKYTGAFVKFVDIFFKLTAPNAIFPNAFLGEQIRQSLNLRKDRKDIPQELHLIDTL